MQTKISAIFMIVVICISQLADVTVFADSQQKSGIVIPQYVLTEEEKGVLELALIQDDGAKAADLINSLTNLKAYEIALEEVLNLYYKDDENLDSRLESFSKTLDERAAVILQDFKEALEERQQKLSVLGYEPTTILVAFEYYISDEDIMECVNSLAAGGRIILRWPDNHKCLSVDLKKSQTTQKAIELFQSIDGVIDAERNGIGYLPEKDFIKIVLNKKEISIRKKQSKKLIATLPKGKSKLVWSSYDPSVAKVDKNGNVTGVGKGRTFIVVKCVDIGYASAACIVNVSGTEKVSAKGKVIVSESSSKKYKNQLITSYSQMKELIKKYESSKNADKKVLKQMASYDSKFFKKYALCFTTCSKANGYKVSIGNVYLNQTKSGKYRIKVKLDVKKPNKKYAKNTKTHFCFVQVSKSAGRKSKSVIFA